MLAAPLTAVVMLSAAVLPSGARAAQGTQLSLYSARQVTSTKTASGAVAQLTVGGLTIQRSGGARGVMTELVDAANALGAARDPYVWGGGHGQAGNASVGVRGGPGYNGKRRGFDCSGTVAAVLVAAGLWQNGDSVPNDANVIATLKAEHLILPGAGRGKREVTLYDRPGVHIFMNIDGRFFGTSDGNHEGNRKGGPGWLPGRSTDARSRKFKKWHFKAALLTARNTASLLMSFTALGDWELAGELLAGQQVSVAYSTSNAGVLQARTVSALNATTVSGTVSAVTIAPDGFALALADGENLSFVNDSDDYDVEVGEPATVTYTSVISDGETVNQAWQVTDAASATGIATTGAARLP
jgi:hypothetical protein